MEEKKKHSILYIILKPLILLISPFFTKYVCWWSNLRCKKSRHICVPLAEEDTPIFAFQDIKRFVKKAKAKFKWTADGIDKLFDAIIPPPHAYQEFLNNDKFRHDCDGFHSLIHYYLSRNGIECYLLTVLALGGSHCVLLFRYEGKWYVNDYAIIYGAYNTVKEAVSAYNEIYEDLYNPRTPVMANNFINYNYPDGKLYKESKSRMMRM